jgi:polyisoprenoid-binding protein YceI
MTDITEPALAVGSWVVDQARSSIRFTIRNLGIFTVRGRFTRFEATVVVGDDGEAAIEAVVYLDSIDTGIAKRDAHLKSADFFDVDHRPTLTFRAPATSVSREFSVKGRATIGVAGAPVVLRVEWGSPLEFTHTAARLARLLATGQVKRSDFGIGGRYLGLLSDDVRVDLDIRLIAPVDA